MREARGAHGPGHVHHVHGTQGTGKANGRIFSLDAHELIFISRGVDDLGEYVLPEPRRKSVEESSHGGNGDAAELGDAVEGRGTTEDTQDSENLNKFRN